MADLTVNGVSIGSNVLNDSAVNTNLDVQAGTDNNHTITVGNGRDTISIGNSDGNIVSLGSGNDQLSLGEGDNTISLGNGIDLISINSGDTPHLETISAGVGTYSFINIGNTAIQLAYGTSNNVTHFSLTPNAPVNGLYTYTLTAQNSNVDNGAPQTISNNISMNNSGNVLLINPVSGSQFSNPSSLPTVVFTNAGTQIQQSFSFTPVAPETITIVANPTQPLTITLSPSLTGIGAIFDTQTVATAAGGITPYIYSILATGVGASTQNFTANSFTFSPQTFGNYNVTATVTDSQSTPASASAQFALSVNTLDLSASTDQYSIAADFSSNQQVSTFDFTNSQSNNFPLNGLTSVRVLGSQASDSFNINAVSGSSYLGSSNVAFSNTLNYGSDSVDSTLTFTYNGFTRGGTVSNGTVTDQIANFQSITSGSQTDIFNLTSVTGETIFGNGSTNTFNFTSDLGSNSIFLFSGGTTTINNAFQDFFQVGGGSPTINLNDVSHLFFLMFSSGANITYTGPDGGNNFFDLFGTGTFNITNIPGNDNFYSLGTGTYNIDNAHGGLSFLGQGSGAPVIFNISNVSGASFLQQSNDGIFNLTNVSNTGFIVGNPSTPTQNTGSGTFQFQIINGVTTDGGGNGFDLPYQPGTYTFTGLNNDNVTLVYNDTLLLDTVSNTLFYDVSSNDVQNFTFAISNNVTTDGGGNTFNLGLANVSPAVYTFTGIHNDTLDFSTSNATADVYSDAGGNVLDMNHNGAANTSFIYNLAGLNGDTVNLSGNTNNYALTLGAIISSNTLSIAHTIFNSYGNTDFNFTAGTDAGDNTFNLYNGGTNTFENLSTDPNHPDIINLNSSYSLSFSGGGVFTLEDTGGTGSVTGNLLDLTNGDYSVSVINDIGGSSFRLYNGVYTLSNTSSDVINFDGTAGTPATVIFNGNTSGSFFILPDVSANLSGISFGSFNIINTINAPPPTITLTNDGGGNTFNLSPGASEIFSGISNDNINLADLNNVSSVITVNNDGGGNTINITAGGSNTLGGLTGDTVNLDAHNYTVSLVNDGGSNIFTLGDSSLGVVNLTNSFSGLLGNDTFNLVNGGYTLNLSGNGAGNLINLLSNVGGVGGSDTFTGLAGDTLNLDDGVYNITTTGGGDLTIETNLGATPLGANGGQTFYLNNGDYNIILVNDNSDNGGGGNTFNITGGGHQTFTGEMSFDTINLDNNPYTIEMLGGGRINTNWADGGFASFNVNGTDITFINTSDFITLNAPNSNLTLDNANVTAIAFLGGGSNTLTFTLNNGVTTDGGQNGIQLNNGGSYTLNNLTQDYIYFSIQDFDYTVNFVNDLGGNFIQISNGSDYDHSLTLTGLNNQANNDEVDVYNVNTILNLTDIGSTQFNYSADGEKFLFTLANGVTTDAGGNYFNLTISAFGTYYFENLSTTTPDTIDIYLNTVYLSKGGVINLIAYPGSTVNLDNGNYTLNLSEFVSNFTNNITYNLSNGVDVSFVGASSPTPVGLSNDTINILDAVSPYTITVVNEDGGSNSFVIGAANSQVSLDGIGNDNINISTAGNTINFSNEWASNTINLTGGGSDTFAGMASDVFSLDNNAYNITLNNNGGSNTFNIGTGIFTVNVTDSFDGLHNDTINLFVDGFTLAFTNDAGSNIINLSSSGTYTFSGLVNDTVNLGNSAFILNISGSDTLDTFTGGNGAVELSLSGVYGNNYNLAPPAFGILKNTISYQSDATDNLYVVYDGSTGSGTVTSNGVLFDNITNMQRISGNELNDTFTMTSIQGMILDTYGGNNNFIFNSDGGNNVINLHGNANGGGSSSFQGLTNDTVHLDPSVSPFSITVQGGGNTHFTGSGQDFVFTYGPVGNTYDFLNTLGPNTIQYTSDNTDSSLTFTYNGNGNSGTVDNGTVSDSINNFSTIYSNPYDSVFNLTNTQENLYIFSPTTTINMTSDPGGNQIFILTATDATLSNLNGDYINDYSGGAATFTLDNVSHTNFSIFSAGATFTDTLSAGVSTDGGNNNFTLYGTGVFTFNNMSIANYNFSNIYNNLFFYSGDATINFNNSTGGNSVLDIGQGHTVVNLNDVSGNNFTLFSPDVTANMHDVSNVNFFVGNPSGVGVGAASFIFDFNNGVSTDGGGNTFWQVYQAGTYSFTGLNNDTVYLVSWSDTLLLDSVGNTKFYEVSNKDQIFTFSTPGGITTDLGGNKFYLGTANYTFTGIQNDTINLQSTSGNLVVNSDAGGNTISINSNGANLTSFSHNLTGLFGDTVNLPGNGNNYSLVLDTISNTIFNSYSNTDFNFIAGTDGGNNTFNLYNGGTNTFENLTTDTNNPDIINFNSPYTVTITGGGAVVLEDSLGQQSLTGDAINFDSGDYSVILYNDVGGNTFNLNSANVDYSFTNAANDIFNFGFSGDTLTLIGDQGGNTFVLPSGSGTVSFVGVSNDSFDLQNTGSYFTISLSGGGSNAFSNLTDDVFNLAGNFLLTLAQNGGGNTFTYTGGGTETIQNLSSSAPDVINLNGSDPYAVTLFGGGNAILENIASGPLSNDTFQLHGSYSISVYDDGGNNTFNLNGGGIETFNILNNTNNISGDTINLDNSNYTIRINDGFINNTINGGSGTNSLQYLGSNINGNIIDGGSGGSDNNTVDFSNFTVANNDVLNIDLVNHQAYMTSNGLLLGSVDTILDFNNVTGSDSATSGETIKVNNLSGTINGGNGGNATVDLSALGSAVDLTASAPNWSNIQNISLNANQSLTIDSAGVTSFAPTANSTNTLAITAPAGETGTLTTAGGWTETAGPGVGSGPVSMNGHVYDIYSANLNGHTANLLVDENIQHRNVH